MDQKSGKLAIGCFLLIVCFEWLEVEGRYNPFKRKVSCMRSCAVIFKVILVKFVTMEVRFFFLNFLFTWYTQGYIVRH
jgi:hypothetical protein